MKAAHADRRWDDDLLKVGSARFIEGGENNLKNFDRFLVLKLEIHTLPGGILFPI